MSREPVVFDLPFDLLGNLSRDHVMAAFPDRIEKGAAWSFAIVFAPDGVPFGRLEMTPPRSSKATGSPVPSTPPAAIGTELEIAGDLPAAVRLADRQRRDLAALDRMAVDCYVRTRRGGEPHWRALPIARDDMAIRLRVRRKAA